MNGVTDTAPTPMGGTVADGTYTITKATAYGGPTGPLGMAKGTLKISGMSYENVDGNGVDTGGTFTTSGTNITINVQCTSEDGGSTGTQMSEYTANATTLDIFNKAQDADGGTVTIVVEFTKM